MDIGLVLRLTLNGKQSHQEKKTYRSKVIDRRLNEIMIAYPTSQGIEKFPIKENSLLTIEFIDKGSVFKFETKVLRIEKDPIQSFVIRKPDKHELTKIQRRQYVRIRDNVDLAVHSPENRFPPFTSVTVDISGGGLAMIVPRDLEIFDGEIVKLYIVLKSSYSDFVYIKTKAEVIRSVIINEVRQVAVRFHLIHEQDRQKIIKYCFEKQREALQL